MKNKVHNIDFLQNELPDKCADLIIADPPYFEVKGEFDFIWDSFESYLQDVEKWANECKRILKDNGSLFWYGDRRNIAYSQVILDKYLTFLNHIYWQKAEKSFTEKYDTLRSFYTRGFERILFYANEDDLNLTECIYHIRDYIRAEIEKAKGKVILKHVNEALGTATNGGGVASACLSLDKTEPTMITEEMYKRLQDWCAPHMAKPYTELREDYEQLRAEYEESRRPFNNTWDLSDHWRFTIGNANEFEHDTVKPEKMTRVMIQTTTKKGGLIVIPFAGSGTECAMAIKEGREFVGFEIDPKHCQDANARVRPLLDQKTLF